MVPYALSVSPLDCESLGVVMGFDFTCRSNHSEVLADALGISPGLEKFLSVPNARMISHEPAIQFAIDDDCKTQCRVSFRDSHTAFHVRTGDFPKTAKRLLLMVRRFESLTPARHTLTSSSVWRTCVATSLITTGQIGSAAVAVGYLAPLK